ncbi:MAG: bluetail domain-containing putative surface protein, partial [Cuspidothrix sp.]
TADYSNLNQSITLLATGIINKTGGGTDQLIKIETINANSSVENNTIDASTTGTGASITVNLATRSLIVNGVPGVGPFTVVNFDNVKGTNANDTITGDSQNNPLFGNGGNDIFISSLGNDTLDGGLGTDTADYSNLNQSITLLATGIINKTGGGTDQLIKIETINANSSVENNTIDASTTGTGASITVNLATRSLIVNGVPGVGPFIVVNFDNVKGTNANDTITGDSQNNQLFGNGGNDYLDGGAGNDTMNGGSGNDIYVIDTTGDVVTEISTLSTEIDTVQSSISYTLGANLENLTLTGTAAINGTGNSLNNTITGNAANNILNAGVGNDSVFGMDGNDTISGGVGSDTLTGGLGADRFVYSNFNDSLLAAPDRITDFNPGEGDRIALTALPTALFNAGIFSTATTLNAAAIAAYQDGNPNLAGKQSLAANQALLFGCNGGTYLSVIYGLSAFNYKNDLLINVTGITGTIATGLLTTNSFFSL